MTCLGAFVASAERGLCGAQPRAGFHLLGRRGLRARCVFAPYLCVWSWGCARSRCVRWAPPGGDVDPADHRGHGGGSARRRTRAARVSVPSRKTRDSPRHCSEPSAHSLTVYGSRPMAHLHLGPPVSRPPDATRSLPDRSDRSRQSESHVIHASKASNLEAELSKCIRPVWGSQATRTLH